MSIPDYQSVMLPFLLAAAAGEIRIGDAVGRLADQLQLSPEDRTQFLPSALKRSSRAGSIGSKPVSEKLVSMKARDGVVFGPPHVDRKRSQISRRE